VHACIERTRDRDVERNRNLAAAEILAAATAKKEAKMSEAKAKVRRIYICV